LRNNKNELLYQNWIWKILRHQNHIICVIFKVKGRNCVFPETSGMPPMFDTFLILIHILSIPTLLQKSKLIGL
jgi:hypothetical protein